MTIQPKIFVNKNKHAIILLASTDSPISISLHFIDQKDDEMLMYCVYSTIYPNSIRFRTSSSMFRVSFLCLCSFGSEISHIRDHSSFFFFVSLHQNIVVSSRCSKRPPNRHMRTKRSLEKLCRTCRTAGTAAMSRPLWQHKKWASNSRAKLHLKLKIPHLKR